MWLLKEEYRKQSGIYYIFNVIQNKMYIGKCSDSKGLQTRIGHHYNALKRRKHDNAYLQHSFNKYGEETFKVGVLQLCTKEDTLLIEQQWLSKALLFKEKYYNSAFISEGHIYIRDETKKKLSESHKGKIRSERYRKNISKSQRGKKRKDNSTGYTGISIKNNKYCMLIRRYKKQWSLSPYDTAEEASKDYQYALTLSDDDLTKWIEERKLVLKRKTTSNYAGVSFDKRIKRWHSYHNSNNKRKNIGYYLTEEEAYLARQEYLNKIEDNQASTISY